MRDCTSSMAFFRARAAFTFLLPKRQLNDSFTNLVSVLSRVVEATPKDDIEKFCLPVFNMSVTFSVSVPLPFNMFLAMPVFMVNRGPILNAAILSDDTAVKLSSAFQPLPMAQVLLLIK